jgi:hypothetical protein
MQVGDALAELLDDRFYPLLLESSLFLLKLVQVACLTELHHHVDTLLIVKDVVQLDDVGMA